MVNSDRPSTLGSGTGSDTKTLEHAPPSEPIMHSPGFRALKSLEKAPGVSARKHDVAPGAHQVPNSSTSRPSRHPINLYAFAREFTNEESKQEDCVPNSGRARTGAHDSSLLAVESGLYAVEAEPVPDDREEGTMMFAEAQCVMMKWYQRRVYRWILVGSILFACALVGAIVVLVLRPTSAASSYSSTPPTLLVPTTGAPPITKQPTTEPPTSKPTPLTPLQIACNFLSIRNETKCQSTVKFESQNAGNLATGSTIPSEIGLLTQLTSLDFSVNALTSTIPSEIGLLTNLTYLSFYDNALNGTIPSEIGLLTKLTGLDFFDNLLNSTIPSEIGRLKELIWMDFTGNEQLKGTIPSSLCSLSTLASAIFIDCAGNITCASGCCSDSSDHLPCG